MNTDPSPTRNGGKRKAGLALRAACVFLLTACASHPMGLSDAEWKALSPERQAELRVQQYEIHAQRQAAREEEARKRAEVAAAEERARQERLDALRANARYGDILLVSLQGGAIESGGKLFACDPVAFEILRGERKRVTLVGSRTDGKRTHRIQDPWWVRLSEDGLTLVFNESGFGQPIPLVDGGDWEKGKTAFLSAHGQAISGGVHLSGMSATIRFREAPGMPQRLILEHR